MAGAVLDYERGLAAMAAGEKPLYRELLATIERLATAPDPSTDHDDADATDASFSGSSQQ